MQAKVTNLNGARGFTDFNGAKLTGRAPAGTVANVVSTDRGWFEVENGGWYGGYNQPTVWWSKDDAVEYTGGGTPAGDVLIIAPGQLQVQGTLSDGTVKHFQNDVEIVVPETYG